MMFGVAALDVTPRLTDACEASRAAQARSASKRKIRAAIVDSARTTTDFEGVLRA
jgi:hypothetical protein